MNRLISPVLVCLALAAGAGSLAASVPAAASSSQNIVQVAASSPQFSTLVSLVKKAGLVGALSGSAKLTVFAPTNAAFAAVPKATLDELAANRSLLVKVLEYHVVKGEVLASQVVKLHSVKTLEGANVKITLAGGNVYVNKAKVIKTNVRASNGVIHVINEVLLPPGA
jgi:uncharacterized surface protein with fasciclin (FAS1) repeats